MEEEILFGNRLLSAVPVPPAGAKFALIGKNRRGQPMAWPIDEGTLSKHMLLLGAIGMGKSNAMNNIVRSIRDMMTTDDIMFIFDTKGDYYNEFCMPGDVVISNDRRATNGSRPDYWNLFGEVMIDDRWTENATEIAKTIFADRQKKRHKFSFQMQLRICLQHLYNACVVQLVSP